MGKSEKVAQIVAEVAPVEKKKKKKTKTEEAVVVVDKRPSEETEEPTKKKKKAKTEAVVEETKKEVVKEEPQAEGEKKKKKKKAAEESKPAEDAETETAVEPPMKKKKKSKDAEKVEEKVEETKEAVEETKEVVEEKEEEKKEAENNSVVVFGLTWEATEETVKKDFEECGAMISFRMPMQDGQSKGMCFIDFADAKGREAAMLFNETEYAGRTLRVRLCEPEKGGKGKGKKGDAKGKGKKGKGKGEKPEGCCSIIVKHMSKDTTEDSLRSLFDGCGTISHAKILTDRDTGESKGIGFIDFESTECTDAAVKKNNSELDGATVYVDFSGPKEDKGGKKGDGKKGKGKDGKGKGKGKDGKGKGKGKKGNDPIRAANQGSLQEGAGKAQSFSDSE